MPTDVGIIDTMIGFPGPDFGVYDFIQRQVKDAESAEFDFPVEYMFKNVPKRLYGTDDDPVGVTLGEMDRFGIEIGLIGCEGAQGERALRDHPDRFVACAHVDPNDVMGELGASQCHTGRAQWSACPDTMRPWAQAQIPPSPKTQR